MANKSEEGLQGLEFMVSVDYYLNETTRFADIILPPVGPFEKEPLRPLLPPLRHASTGQSGRPPLFEPEEKPGYTDFEILTS